LSFESHFFGGKGEGEQAGPFEKRVNSQSCGVTRERNKEKKSARIFSSGRALLKREGGWGRVAKTGLEGKGALGTGQRPLHDSS